MADKSELAAFLALLNGYYQKQDTNMLDATTRGERCRTLNRSGILSLAGIAAVIGCSIWQVERAIVGMSRPASRGKLNPQHLSMLAYTLSSGKISKEWLDKLLEEGTSLSTVSDLTGISPATLYRVRSTND